MAGIADFGDFDMPWLNSLMSHTNRIVVTQMQTLSNTTKIGLCETVNSADTPKYSTRIAISAVIDAMMFFMAFILQTNALSADHIITI